MKAYTHRKMEASEAKMSIADHPYPAYSKEANQCMEVRRESKDLGEQQPFTAFLFNFNFTAGILMFFNS